MSQIAKQALRTYHSTGLRASASVAAKSQPWKTFWPLNKDNYTPAQQSEMPWLTWKPDPAKPDDKPWRQWMLKEQAAVTRRGSSW